MTDTNSAGRGERGARAIAFYLPQFHRIPENDEWWGEGFTEWTNTRKAKPLFTGHLQPRVPTELGYYDLTDAATRSAQAALAQAYGIEGFCYWHYWFGGGRRILERPFEEVLQSGEPDFPFALCWANESWTGVWHGAPGRTLLKQEYPGVDDYRVHFSSILPALRDKRYITVNGKPIFLVYSPARLPSAGEFCDIFRQEAEEAGLPGLHLIAMGNTLSREVAEPFDAEMRFGPGEYIDAQPSLSAPRRIIRRAMASPAAKYVPGIVRKALGAPLTFDYRKMVQTKVEGGELSERQVPSVMSGWDNTPRSGRRGTVFSNFTPALFGQAMQQAVSSVQNRPEEERLIFIKAWNEWAEGNVLEPAEPYGRAFLDEVLNAVSR